MNVAKTKTPLNLLKCPPKAQKDQSVTAGFQELKQLHSTHQHLQTAGIWWAEFGEKVLALCNPMLGSQTGQS